MTIPIHPLDSPATAAKESAPTARPSPSPEALHAAREFEQIFLRKMLSVLEKTGRTGKEGAMSAGNDIYSSMVVNALSESIAAAGGIGLADLIARSTMSPAAPPPPTAPSMPDQEKSAVPSTNRKKTF